MAKFVYRAKHGLEKTLEGTVEAENSQEALSKLIARGLAPISLEIESRVPAHLKVRKSGGGFKRYLFSKRIPSQEILHLTQKLTTLTKANVDLISSLRILEEQTEHPGLRAVIVEIRAKVKEGKVFSESLARFPHLFSPLFVNMIRAGEVSGCLDSSLEQLSTFLDREESLKTKISVALAYPLLLLFIGMMSIFVLLTFVVPKLRPIFESMRTELPWVTRMILNISSFSSKTWLVGIGAILLGVIGLKKWRGDVYFKGIVRRIRSHLPIVRRLTQHQELAHFTKSLSLLLKSGVPVLKSIEIATPTIEDPKLRMGLKKVAEEITSGQNLSRSMENFTDLPPFLTKMIAVGEESGRLSEVLEEIFHSYTQQIEADISRISALIEPILILLIGMILGTIVLSILLPTFQVTQNIH